MTNYGETLKRMLQFDEEEYNNPHTYHTGHELPELFEFFNDDAYFGPRTDDEVGDVVHSVTETVDLYHSEQFCIGLDGIKYRMKFDPMDYDAVY